jgi:hypothetical protein
VPVGESWEFAKHDWGDLNQCPVRRGEGGAALDADVPPTGRVRSGSLIEFLRRDLFTVQLDDGRKVTAVMPEELFSIYDPNVRLTRVNRPRVEVEMRDPPALPRIVSAHPSSFCGPGY